MGELLTVSITAGPIVLGLGLLAVLVCLAIYLFTPSRKAGKPLLHVAVELLGIGFVSFVAGTALGIAVFCSTASAGNLCGLGGVFGVGPLLCGLCIGGYAWRWLDGTRATA